MSSEYLLRFHKVFIIEKRLYGEFTVYSRSLIHVYYMASLAELYNTTSLIYSREPPDYYVSQNIA
jgi:hypothetical protein